MLDGCEMFSQVAAGENAAVHFRMQCLDATIEHFREAGVVADFGDGKSCVAQQFGGAAGGQQVDALGREALSKLKRTALVGKADESLADFHGAVS